MQRLARCLLMVWCSLFTGPLAAANAPRTLIEPWDFYWQRFLAPEDPLPAADHQISPNRGWNQQIDPSTKAKRPAASWGTYRLEIKGLLPRPEGYELQFPFIATASHIFIFNKDDPDHRVEGLSGRLGTTREAMVPQIRDVILKFTPRSAEETWVVLVQTSNFYHASGGILTAPVLGPAPLLSAQSHIDQLGYIFSMGVILVVCIYNVMLFVRRREDISSLMLATFCLTAAARTFANGNLGNLFFPTHHTWPFLFKYVLEYSTLALEPLTYTAFIHISFRSASWPRIMPAFTIFGAVGTLLTLVSLPITYGKFLAAYQVGIVLQALFALVVLFRAIRLQLEGARLALGSAFVLAFTIAYDILVSYNVFPQPYIMQFGIDVFVFLQSQVVARRFATAFRTAERLQNELQLEVERQTQDIRSMMEHVPQGIFLVLDDMTIQPHYSRHLEDILGRRNLGGRQVSDLLFEGQCITREQQSIIDTIMLSAFGSDLYAWDVNCWQLPRELQFDRGEGQRRILEIDWNPVIGKTQMVERLLITIRDVTSMRVLQAENQHRQAELDGLIELLGTAPGTLPRFFEQAAHYLDRGRDRLQADMAGDDIKRLVFIELHTLKGLARSQGLRRLTSAVHEAEQGYGKEQPFHKDKRLAELAGLEHLLQEYRSIYQHKLSREANKGAELHLEKQHLIVLEAKLQSLRNHGPDEGPARDLMHAVQDFLGVYLYRGAHQVIDELMHEVERLAGDLGKEKPQITLSGLESLRLLPETERIMQATFLHVVRNSLDHGIEAAEERQGKGKAPQGHITIRVSAEDGRYVIDYGDDGRGVDIQLIEARARARGLWNGERAMTIAEATELLFHPGFSTKSTVSEISGRGVGLDAVRMAYRELGGDVRFNLDGVDAKAGENIPFRLWAFLPGDVALNIPTGMKRVS